MELTKPEGGSLMARPDFMEGDQAMGAEDLGKFIVPPRVKVMQPLRGEEYRKYNEGDVILSPQLVMVAPVLLNEHDKPSDSGTPFHFVPLFFFPEWCCWHPIKTRGTLPAVRYRTIDPNDPAVAKSRNPQLRNEVIEGHDCKWVEHLNYVCVLVGHEEIAHTPVVMSFARAEHRRGTNFAALVKMRNAPMFGCQFEARTGFRSNAQGNWYGIDVANPSAESGITPFIADQAVYEAFRDLHVDLKAAHELGKVKVDYEDEVVEETEM